MKFLIQRVLKAEVKVDEKIVGKINKGFLVFIGISNEDNKEIADKMISKMLGLRIFADDEDKINLNLNTVHGELLLVSQFTLYADCKKGNRPSFIEAAKPNEAKELYEYIIDKCSNEDINVQTGIFGADMKISLINDGPFTIELDSDLLCRNC